MSTTALKVSGREAILAVEINARSFAPSYAEGKPDPEPYVKGSTLLRFSPMDCVVVEEVPAGIRSGKGAGAKVIAFTTTVAPDQLQAAGADWILSNCGAIRLDGARSELQLSLELSQNWKSRPGRSPIPARMSPSDIDRDQAIYRQ